MSNCQLSSGGGFMRHRIVRSIVLLTPVRSDRCAIQFLACASRRREEGIRRLYQVRLCITRTMTSIPTAPMSRPTSWALKVLSEQGVARAQEASVSVSDRLEKLEILSAYTLKKDGRKINVPPTNFQDETNTGKGTRRADVLRHADPDGSVSGRRSRRHGGVVVQADGEWKRPFPGNFSMLEIVLQVPGLRRCRR